MWGWRGSLHRLLHPVLTWGCPPIGQPNRAVVEKQETGCRQGQGQEKLGLEGHTGMQVCLYNSHQCCGRPAREPGSLCHRVGHAPGPDFGEAEGRDPVETRDIAWVQMLILASQVCQQTGNSMCELHTLSPASEHKDMATECPLRATLTGSHTGSGIWGLWFQLSYVSTATVTTRDTGSQVLLIQMPDFTAGKCNDNL